ncbi:DUF6074 family protein [Devosia sp. 1635]|uniref:DUF6074 family protein n=1 Tax=Devosia sp. 1635 TaxID=2726066 RepID=UPI0015667B31|nr:DUF6074 family protein [Devosia sp. 1635]
MMQLDLFAWTPPQEIVMEASVPAPAGATIICFPQRRNIGKARHVAVLLLRRAEGPQRETYWSQVCNRMAGTLDKVGMDDAEIDRQLRAFAETVSSEMCRLSNTGLQQPGGAA